MYAKLGKTGEIKLPETILEQVKAEGFTVTLQGETIVLSPVAKTITHFNRSPAERAAEFQVWMARIETDTSREKTNISTEALRRENMYEDRL